MRMQLFLIGTAFAATLAGLAACTRPTQFGSWTHAVKSAVMDSDADDAAETVKVLAETNQKFVIYNIDSSKELTDFLDLLYVAGAEDIDVYAAVDAPHLSHAESRLFDLAGIDMPDCECLGKTDTDWYNCKKACIEAWHKAWIAAAEEMSQYASLYENLKGFVINDFDMYVESIDYPQCRYGDHLSLDQVEEIRDAIKSHDPDLEFWPVCYPASFGRVIGDGYIMGASYGVRLYPGDRMSVFLSFALTDLPSIASLVFLHRDTVNSESDGTSDCYCYDADKQVLVNGTLVWSASLAGDQSVERWIGDIAPHLQVGDNTVELRLDAGISSQSNGCGTLFWRCWDVTLEITEATDTDPYFTSTFATLTPTYAVEWDDTAYAPTTGCYGAWMEGDYDSGDTVSNDGPRCAGLPDSEVLGRAASWLIAAPNRDYLIHNAVDGIIAPWYRTDRPDYGTLIDGACSSGPVWPADGTIETYSAIIGSAVLAVGRDGVIVLQRGIPTDSEFNLDVQVEQLNAAAEIAGGVGIWDMACGVQRLDTKGGVFAERAPLVAYWPGRQSSLPGWYQRWTSAPIPKGTTINVTVSSSRAGDSDAVNLMVWRIFDGSGTLIDEVDLADASDPHGPYEVAADGSGVVLEVQLVGGVGNWSAKVTFEATDSDGKPLGVAWTFETGVDWEVERSYEAQRSVFLTEPGP